VSGDKKTILMYFIRN